MPEFRSGALIPPTYIGFFDKYGQLVWNIDSALLETKLLTGSLNKFPSFYEGKNTFLPKNGMFNVSDLFYIG
jgi:hypothetical protein